VIGDEHIAGNEKQNGCKSSIHVTAYHVSSQSIHSSSPSDRQYLPDQWPEPIVRSFRACTTCSLVLLESHEKIQDRPPDQVVYQVLYTPHLPIQICREGTRNGWPYCSASFADLKLREGDDWSHLIFHLSRVRPSDTIMLKFTALRSNFSAPAASSLPATKFLQSRVLNTCSDAPEIHHKNRPSYLYFPVPTTCMHAMSLRFIPNFLYPKGGRRILLNLSARGPVSSSLQLSVTPVVSLQLIPCLTHINQDWVHQETLHLFANTCQGDHSLLLVCSGCLSFFLSWSNVSTYNYQYPKGGRKLLLKLSQTGLQVYPVDWASGFHQLLAAQHLTLVALLPIPESDLQAFFWIAT
jgi:hypothetical protein